MAFRIVGVIDGVQSWIKFVDMDANRVEWTRDKDQAAFFSAEGARIVLDYAHKVMGEFANLKLFGAGN